MVTPTPFRRYRNLTPPLVLILAVTGGNLGCESRATREARENESRRRAEVEHPSPQVLDQVRTATGRFMTDRHADLEVEGMTLTALTPNAFLVGVSVKHRTAGNRWVAQLTAERVREDGSEGSDMAWVIDYAEPTKLQQLSQRHGFGHEVSRISGMSHQASWGHRSFLDDMLLWHFLFNRPPAYGWSPMGGFSAMPRGYRFQDPTRPIQAQDGDLFRSAAAPTGGRSSVFLGGSAWRPPTVAQAGPLSGHAYSVSPSGSVGSRVGLSSVGRGGFGSTGRAAAFGGGS